MKKRRLFTIFPLVFVLFGCSFNLFNKNKNKTPDSGGNKEEEKVMLSLNTNSISISKEKTYKLEATVDSSLSKYLLFWSVENENVATIDDDGLVHAVNTGYTICIAQCGRYQARCAVEVTPYVPNSSFSVSFEKTTFSLNVNDTYKLVPTVKLGDTVITNYSSTGAVSNSSVISYSNDVISALSAGESDILLTYSYQEYSVQQLLHVVVY